MADPRQHKAPDQANLVGAKLGNYRLERVIGRGRMGVVYLAQDEALLRPTAIKLLAWSAAEANGHDPVQWFLTEARLIARVNHPDVVQIYGAARQGDHCYIAMEYVPGLSAEATVARGGPLPPEQATHVLLKAASALYAAHLSGIVHRDVKPGNLLLGGAGVVKLSDFGMALGSAGHGTPSAHVRVGTPYYTAPEVWRGEAASPASDIYSLGATYFHLLTGRPPYAGEDVAAIERAHLRAAVPDPRQFTPRLPPSCARLIERALAKSPRDRHPSAEALSSEGRQVLRELGSQERTPAAVSSTPPVARASPGAPRPAPNPGREAPRAPGAPTAPPVPAPLVRALGLVRRPFLEVDPGDPFLLEPLASTQRRLFEAAADPSAALIAVTGASGCGAGLLCRATASGLAASRRVLVASGCDREGRSVLDQLCRAAGLSGAGADEARASALIERMVADGRGELPPALVFLEGVAAPESVSALARLVAAALFTRGLKVVLAGEPGLLPELLRAGVDLPAGRLVEIPVPRFNPDETSRYVRGWLDAALTRGSPPLLLSPDAALLLAHRSGGAVERLNCLAENMLMLAAAQGTRVLTSWHAWTASDAERWAEARTLSEMPRRPESWPAAEVVPILDACRRAAGLAPWPRAPGGDLPASRSPGAPPQRETF